MDEDFTLTPCAELSALREKAANVAKMEKMCLNWMDRLQSIAIAANPVWDDDHFPPYPQLNATILQAREKAAKYDALTTLILKAHGVLPANWVYTDAETTLDLLVAEITTTRHERDALWPLFDEMLGYLKSEERSSIYEKFDLKNIIARAAQAAKEGMIPRVPYTFEREIEQATDLQRRKVVAFDKMNTSAMNITRYHDGRISVLLSPGQRAKPVIGTGTDLLAAIEAAMKAEAVQSGQWQQ